MRQDSSAVLFSGKFRGGEGSDGDKAAEQAVGISFNVGVIPQDSQQRDLGAFGKDGASDKKFWKKG